MFSYLDKEVVKNALVILTGIMGLLSSIVGVGFLSDWLKADSGFQSRVFLLGAFLFMLGMVTVVLLLARVIEG